MNMTLEVNPLDILGPGIGLLRLNTNVCSSWKPSLIFRPESHLFYFASIVPECPCIVNADGYVAPAPPQGPTAARPWRAGGLTASSPSVIFSPCRKLQDASLSLE